MTVRNRPAAAQGRAAVAAYDRGAAGRLDLNVRPDRRVDPGQILTGTHRETRTCGPSGAAHRLSRTVTDGDIGALICGLRKLVDGLRAGEAIVHRRDSPVPPKWRIALADHARVILLRIVRGLSNADIAQELYLSPRRVKSRASYLLVKLDLRDRVQAVARANETALITAGARALP